MEKLRIIGGALLCVGGLIVTASLLFGIWGLPGGPGYDFLYNSSYGIVLVFATLITFSSIATGCAIIVLGAIIISGDK